MPSSETPSDTNVRPDAATFALQDGANGEEAASPTMQHVVEDVRTPSPVAVRSIDLGSMSTSSSQELSQATSKPEPHFLSLPAELRNNIIRLSIVSHEKIKIATNTIRPPQEPAMLRVNRQTRHEAVGIYYYENHFRFDMHNFDARAYIAWVQARPTFRARLQVWFKLYAVTSPDLAWDNLMVWLEAIHSRKVIHGPSERAFPGKKKHRVVAGELKELAWRMRGQNLSWSSIWANLASSKKMLAASSTNGKWI